MLYRIIQEMLNNTLKHSQADTIQLQFSKPGPMLTISYSDDGKGFEIEKMMDSSSLGLKSIQSRVDFLGGTLSVESSPGTGTAYLINLPFKSSQND